MTESDEMVLARAVADTFKSLLKGESRHPQPVENIKHLLYYHLNPWNTEAAFHFMGEVVRQVEEVE